MIFGKPFDIVELREKGLDENTINILSNISENNDKESSCTGHSFRRMPERSGRYKCDNCGCIQSIGWVSGYLRGLEHSSTKK